MLVYQKGPVDMWIELFLNGKSSFLFRDICIANDKVCEDDLQISHRRCYCVNSFQKEGLTQGRS